MPRLNRVLASLKSVNCRAVLRTLTKSKLADSMVVPVGQNLAKDKQP